MPDSKENSSPNSAPAETVPGLEAYTAAMMTMPMAILQIMTDTTASIERMPAEAFAPLPLWPTVTGWEDTMNDEAFQPRPAMSTAGEQTTPVRDVMVLESRQTVSGNGQSAASRSSTHVPSRQAA